MQKFDNPLDNVRVASPCSMSWENMAGDDRKRFCGDCNLNVYNLSGMTKYDAENLLRLSEGRLCVRYVERADGTILTKDCPVGWAKVKQRVSIFAAAAFSVFLSLFGAFFVVSFFRKQVVGGITPPPREATMGVVAAKEVMGDVAPEPKSSPKGKTVPLYRVDRPLPIHPGQRF